MSKKKEKQKVVVAEDSKDEAQEQAAVSDNIADPQIEGVEAALEEPTTSELEATIAELQDELLRQRAEVENFKRRTKQEYETNIKFANQHLIEQFLPVLDAFDRALATEETADEQTKQFLKGFKMTETLLKQTLESAGLTVIPTVGSQFDPYLHQAVAQDTDEAKADNEVLEELQKGYKLKDRVIRASMVKTNKK